MSAIEARSPRLRPQRARDVVNAELRRLRRRGGMPGGIITAATVGLAAAIGAFALMTSLAGGVSRVVVTTPIELGGFLTGFLVAIASVFVVGRDQTGHLEVALTLTPRRWRLHLARITAFTVAGAGTTVSVGLIIGTVGVLFGGGALIGHVTFGISLTAVAAASLVVLAVGIATLARRGAAAVLIFVGLLIVLPLGISALGWMLPSTVASAAEAVVNATPTALLLKAIAVSTVPTHGWGGVLVGQFGLAMWATASAILSGIHFSRRGD